MKWLEEIFPRFWEILDQNLKQTEIQITEPEITLPSLGILKFKKETNDLR